jgi:hypothetical protein
MNPPLNGPTRQSKPLNRGRETKRIEEEASEEIIEGTHNLDGDDLVGVDVRG